MISWRSFRRHHHDPEHDGRRIDAGMRFLTQWEDEDGWPAWRGVGDQRTRETVKALLRVAERHADEIRGRGGSS